MRFVTSALGVSATLGDFLGCRRLGRRAVVLLETPGGHDLDHLGQVPA
jgi:hypothetical protein